ncbi:hypothetical protein Sjap_000188 [Stephania japonica]|uniref:Uncharacterized protein n=1 Tax=Stephania japonica TaxID=461633 RepID=A0AAP0PQ62_9MAGN
MRDAIESMNGQDLDGRNITVNEAQSRGSGVVAEAVVSAIAAARLRRRPGRSSSITVTVKKRGGFRHPFAPTLSSKVSGQRGSDPLASRRRSPPSRRLDNRDRIRVRTGERVGEATGEMPMSGLGFSPATRHTSIIVVYRCYLTVMWPAVGPCGLPWGQMWKFGAATSSPPRLPMGENELPPTRLTGQGSVDPRPVDQERKIEKRRESVGEEGEEEDQKLEIVEGFETNNNKIKTWTPDKTQVDHTFRPVFSGFDEVFGDTSTDRGDEPKGSENLKNVFWLKHRQSRRGHFKATVPPAASNTEARPPTHVLYGAVGGVYMTTSVTAS